MLSDIKLGLDKCEKGAIFDFIGAKWFVRKVDHKFYNVLNEIKRHEFGVFYNDDNLSNEQKQFAFSMAIAEHLLVKWVDLYDDGKEVKYTLGTAKGILGNPAYSELVNMIFSFGTNYKNYLDEKKAKDVSDLKKQ